MKEIVFEVIKEYKIILILIGLLCISSIYKCFSVSEKQTDEIKKLEDDQILGERYLPGLTAADVHMNLTNKGFTLDKRFGGGFIEYTCKKKNSESEIIVEAYGRSASQIRYIEVTVLNYSQYNTNDISKWVCSYIATLPYEGSNPTQARDWVLRNISKTTSTIMGKVKFEICANAPRARVFTMKPE